jgi:hypothetical protein
MFLTFEACQALQGKSAVGHSQTPAGAGGDGTLRNRAPAAAGHCREDARHFLRTVRIQRRKINRSSSMVVTGRSISLIVFLESDQIAGDRRKSASPRKRQSHCPSRRIAACRATFLKTDRFAWERMPAALQHSADRSSSSTISIEPQAPASSKDVCRRTR